MPLGRPAALHPSSPPTWERTKNFYCDVLGLENGDDRPPLGVRHVYSGGIRPCTCWARARRAKSIMVRGTEKKYDDTGRLTTSLSAASDLPGVANRLESKKVKFREQIVPRTGAPDLPLRSRRQSAWTEFPPEEPGLSAALARHRKHRSPGRRRTVPVTRRL